MPVPCIWIKFEPDYFNFLYLICYEKEHFYSMDSGVYRHSHGR